MKLRKALRIILLTVAGLVLAVGLLVGCTWLYFHPSFHRVDGVVYGERRGKHLTMDILTPHRPNGVGIVVMVSGGWKSSRPGEFRAWLLAPLLRRGYTVFAVSHVSQPEATVMDIVADVNRAVRYVRYNASKFGVDPKRLGATGGSAGGHLSLMVATRGGPGAAEAADPIERETSAVQAVAVFYPPTDLLNLGNSTENTGDGGPPRSFVRAFGPQSTNLNVWRVVGRETSPIYHIHSNLPPTLILHGDADTLVPLDQSLRYQAEASKVGCTVDVSVHKGGQHGWLTMVFDLRRFANWFDKYLSRT